MIVAVADTFRRRWQCAERGGVVDVAERGRRHERRQRSHVAVLRLGASVDDGSGHRSNGLFVPVRATDGAAERLRTPGVVGGHRGHRGHRVTRRLRRCLSVRRAEPLSDAGDGQHRVLLITGQLSFILLVKRSLKDPSKIPQRSLKDPSKIPQRSLDVKWPSVDVAVDFMARKSDEWPTIRQVT